MNGPHVDKFLLELVPTRFAVDIFFCVPIIVLSLCHDHMASCEWPLQRTLILGLFSVLCFKAIMDRGRLKALFEQDDDDGLAFQARIPPVPSWSASFSSTHPYPVCLPIAKTCRQEQACCFQRRRVPQVEEGKGTRGRRGQTQGGRGRGLACFRGVCRGLCVGEEEDWAWVCESQWVWWADVCA